MRLQDMPSRIVIVNTNQQSFCNVTDKYEYQLNRLKQVSHRPGCGDKDNGNVGIQLKSVGRVLTTAECEAVITGLMGGGRKRSMVS